MIIILKRRKEVFIKEIINLVLKRRKYVLRKKNLGGSKILLWSISM